MSVTTNSQTVSSPTTPLSNHVLTIEEVKEIGPEFVAYRVRCCGEAVTDSWCTVSVMTPDIEAALQDHKNRIATVHEAKLQWRNKNKEVNQNGSS